MRPGLRLKILLITVVTPLALGVAALVTVDRSVRAHVDDSSLHESLDRAAAMFRRMLATRARAQQGGARVIARDPRFFSMLALGVDQRDARFTATVRGMARDLNGITRSDVFEVFDRRGRRLASEGPCATTPGARAGLVREALGGREATRIVPVGTHLVQLTATPVRADRRVVGALVIGSHVDDALAREVRLLLRGEVSFLAHGRITATTLERDADRAAVERLMGAPSEAGESPVRLDPVRLEADGASYLAIAFPLPGAVPGQHVVMQRASDPETLFRERIRRDLGLLALVAVAGALVTGVLLAGSIVRPLRQLVRGAQEMQRGNYAYPVRVRGRDELGYLAQRFVEMRQREQVYVRGLEEAARIKNEFIAVASRELRTPISVLAGYRDLLEGGSLGPLSPQQRQALSAMREALAQLTGVADQATRTIQIRARRLDPRFGEHAVVPLVERAVGAALAAAPGREVRVRHEVPRDLGAWTLDAEQVHEALTRLVWNAIMRTADGGSVHVDAAIVADALEVGVSDDGPEIPRERLARLFEDGHAVGHALQQRAAAPDDEGVEPGLGLGIARGIVEAHGGTIDVAPRPQGGVRFVVRLPRAPARAAA
uniref:histidine kinase n=1 Tax=Eiseniibacteriota bacterium TaxID=2212470 RepID=A0A832I1E6_UNCEI